MRKILDTLNMDNWNKKENYCPSVILPVYENVESHNNLNNEVECKKCEDDYTIQENLLAESIDNFKDQDYNTDESLTVVSQEEITTKAVEFKNQDLDTSESKTLYKSKRLIIQGLNIYFIEICREIINQGKVVPIPLMREYNLSEEKLNEILEEVRSARILDESNRVLMSAEAFENFIDIYEPKLFECKNCIFDKDIFMCIGEIIYDDGIEKTYDSLPADEVIDYLTIYEKLGLIKYNSQNNNFDILKSKEEMLYICNRLPECYSGASTDIDLYNTNYNMLSGIEFENFCSKLLKESGFFQVEITKASRDHGIDILAEKDGITYAIQCKCYSSYIGNSAIQQAHTGKSLYNRDIAVVMTNNYFTPQAKEEACQLGVKLWDKNKIEELLSNGYKG